MAIINYSDLLKDDGAFDDIERKIDNLEKFVTTSAKKLEGALNVVSPEESDEVKRLVSELQALQKEHEKLVALVKKNNAAKKKAKDLTKKEIQAINDEREARRKANAEARLVSKIKKTEANSIENLRAKLSLVTVAWAKLNIKELENTKKGRRLIKSKKDLTESLKKLEKATGDNRRNVGNYNSALTEVRLNLKKFISVLGIAGGAMAVNRIFRDGVDVLIDYDEALVDVEKTTGNTREEVEQMAIALRKIDTKTSITDLLALASAGGRLGLKGQDVVDFTIAVNEAFVALGDTLGGSADEIGLILGRISSNFGVDSEFGIGEGITKIGSSLNELGANSKATEDKIIDFTNRLAGLSSQAGISVTDVQALGALFDESGQSVEIAASSITKFIPELAKNTEEFSKIAGVTAEEFKEIVANNPIEALKQVVSGAKSAEGGLEGLVNMMELLGIENTRAIGIIGVLADKTDRLTELQKIASDAFEAGTSITEEYEKKNTSLSAELDKLGKSWDEMVLSTDDANDSIVNMKGVIIFLTKNLKIIVTAVLKGITVFATLKATLLAVRLSAQLYAVAMKAVAFASVSFSRGIKVATRGVKGFSAAVKKIPFAAIISGIVTVVSLLWDFGEATEENNQMLEDEANLLDKTTGEFVHHANALKNTNAGSEERSRLITEINSKFGTTLKNLKDETAFQNQVNLAVENYIGLQKQKILLQRNQEDVNKQLLLQIEAEEQIERLMDKMRSRQKSGEQLGDTRKRMGIDNEALIRYENQLRNSTKRLEELGVSGLDILNDQADLFEEVTPNGDGITPSIDKKAKDNTKKEFTDLLNDLSDIFEEKSAELVVDPTLGRDEFFAEEARIVDAVFADLEEKHKGNAEFSIMIEKQKLILMSEANEEYIEDLEKRAEAKLKLDAKLAQVEVEILKAKNEILIIEQEKLMEESDDLVRDLIESYDEAKSDEERKAIKDRIDVELDAQNDIFRAKFQLLIDEIELEAELREAQAKARITDAELLAKELEKIELEKNNNISRLSEKLNNDIQLNNSERIETDLEDWKEFREEFKTVVNQIGDKLEELADKQVELSKERLDKQNEQIEEQRDRAEKGLANTLAFEQKELAKKEAQLLASQKRQERIAKAQSIYAAYTANVGNLKEGEGSGKALADTLRDLAILEAITAGFWAGGYTGDGKKHDVAGMVHKGEFVIDKSTTAEMGLRGDSMIDFKNKVLSGDKSGNMNGHDIFKIQRDDFEKKVAPVDNGMAKLTEEVRSLKEWQMSNPQQHIQVGEVVDGVLDFVEEIRKNGMTVRNHHKLSKDRL